MAKPREFKAGPEALQQIEAIYRELDRRPRHHQCTGLAQCCQFRLTGRTPMLTRGEALYAAKAVRASGRTSLPEGKDGACPLLDTAGRCSIYAHRPFGCRTHYCQQAGGAYPRREVADLIQSLDALDEQLGGDGPKSIQSALRQSLEGKHRTRQAMKKRT